MDPTPAPEGSRQILPAPSKPGLVAVALSATTSLLAVLCCAGLPAALSLLGTLGLGILLKKHWLFPLMTLSLLIGLWGAIKSFQRHGSRLLFGGYLLSAAALPLGMKFAPPVMYGGLVLLLFVTGTELARALRSRSCSANHQEVRP